MEKEPRRSLTVVFQPPDSDPTGRHERTFDGVPGPIARQIEEDFAASRRRDAEMSPYQSYRYMDDGREQLLALDYTEIVRIYEKDKGSLAR